MRVLSIGLLVTGLLITATGCTIIEQWAPQSDVPQPTPRPSVQCMTPPLALLPEGHGIKRLSPLTIDPQTDHIFWKVPFYLGHVGGHAVLGKVGQLPRSLDDHFRKFIGASWSRDGDRVALTLDTGTKVPVAPGNCFSGYETDAVYISEDGGITYQPIASGLNYGSGFLSPDGNKLLIRNKKDWNTEQHTLYDLSDHSPKELAPLPSSSEPLWSPDGSTIAFIVQGRTLILYDLKTEKLTQVDTVSDSLLGWAPDSQTVYAGVAKSTRRFAITAFRPDGNIEATSSIDLPTPHGVSYTPMLSPDGTRVAFVSKGLISMGVYLADVHGGLARQVVPPSLLLGWIDPSTLLCKVDKDGSQEVDYTVDLTQR